VDIVFRSGAVYTVEKDNPWAQAVGVIGTDIVYVGSQRGVDARIGPQTTVVDLNGKMLLPGFHDVHMHPDAILPSKCDLVGIDSFEKTLAKIEECAKTKKGEWLQGSGWWASDHTDPTLVEKLDAATGERPAYLVSMDGHQAWINTKAMAIAGITAETPG
jgi:predicted amidohydrolase YtcJ